MPEGLQARHVLGLGLLAGIGFSMSLFIASLVFSGSAELREKARLGILFGSLIAAIAVTVLFLFSGSAERGC